MLKYLPSHEYARVDGDFAYVGISPYAAKQLGNVVYVDMPEEGDEVEKGEEFGAIESVKAASDLFSPVSGEIVEVNAKLEDDPRAVSEDPLANWIIKVKMSNPAEMDELMDQAAYDAHCAAAQH